MSVALQMAAEHDWRERYERDLARREKRNAVRRPPVVYKTTGCRWCGEEVQEADGTPSRRRGWHDGRRDERDCVAENFIAKGALSRAMPLLLDRDGPLCRCGCGALVFRFVAGHEWDQAGLDEASYRRRWKSIHPHVQAYFGAEHPFVEIAEEWDCEVDHTVALWKVTHLPDEERLAFYLLGNLQLLAVPCHRAKTKREAAERAQARRAGGDA